MCTKQPLSLISYIQRQEDIPPQSKQSFQDAATPSNAVGPLWINTAVTPARRIHLLYKDVMVKGRVKQGPRQE